MEVRLQLVSSPDSTLAGRCARGGHEISLQYYVEFTIIIQLELTNGIVA